MLRAVETGVSLLSPVGPCVAVGLSNPQMR